MKKNPLALARLWRRTAAASAYGAAHGVCGLEFDRFGRDLGLRLMLRAYPEGLLYFLNPVSSVRYFEFPFTWSALQDGANRCLDVSSPRLFSLYAAQHRQNMHIDMINPDARDIAITARIMHRLDYTNVTCEAVGVEALSRRKEKYDCIWAISVIEHIFGEYDDGAAMRFMWGALAYGGRLILTVPVDRTYWEEYRDADPYSTQAEAASGKYFFQRYYDEDAIHTRLLAPIGQHPKVIQWFGERTPGHFRAYEKRWQQEGLECTVDDPCEIADYYQDYPSWKAMPGIGVCGLVIEKKEK